jgi:hypothetical protein
LADGKNVEHWAVRDDLALMMQAETVWPRFNSRCWWLIVRV